jgi:hypothetical protein
MKKILLFLFLTLSIKANSQQQNYNDFEGNKTSFFGFYSGTLDSLINNPAISAIDSSAHCARYIRDTTLYDNLQIHINGKLEDISVYASPLPSAPHIKMKLYSTAPVGTPVVIQLGSSSISGYPAGLHSEYTAVTTARNAWQLLTFNFSQMITGGTVGPASIDKIVILFDPNTMHTDTMYFDDLTGPEVVPVGIGALENLSPFKLFQNSPNPVKNITHINFQLNSSGPVSLKLYDMLGNPVALLIDQSMKQGGYSIPVEMNDFPNGIYFYVLKKEGVTRSMKMIVSK